MVCRVVSSNKSQVVRSNYLLLIWYESHSKVNLNKDTSSHYSLTKTKLALSYEFYYFPPNYPLLETIIIIFAAALMLYNCVILVQMTCLKVLLYVNN